VKTRFFSILSLLCAGSAGVFLVVGTLLTAALIHFTGTQALGSQTKEQCHKCCERQGHDEYYLDQCKLQCFRNPDHCTGGKPASAPRAEPAPAAKAPAESRPVPREQIPAQQPMIPREQPRAVQPMLEREQAPAAQRPAAPPRTRAAFQWPNPLTLVPGREADAAAQILVLNGIPPQHPNFGAGVNAVQAVLVDFARNNPAGGSLPTTQLERIIKQLR